MDGTSDLHIVEVEEKAKEVGLVEWSFDTTPNDSW